MDDVFQPIRVPQEEIRDVLFIQSAVPLLKLFIELIRGRETERLTLSIYIDVEELISKLILFLLNKEKMSAPLDTMNISNAFPNI